MLDESEPDSPDPIPTDKDEKTLVLNRISNHIGALERKLPILLQARDWGLQKGKMTGTLNAFLIDELRELADGLETYLAEEFTLDDMQDYKGGL